MSEHVSCFLKQVASNLRAIRNEQHKLQKDVKDDTQIHIARIESGRANIKLSTLKTLCDYYEVPIPRLFEDVG